jgi:7,8-dihydroneopterin aldolase/epimerase/oxygenase
MGTIKQKVSLNNIRFFSYHGFYPEEQIIGNVFFVDIDTEFEVFMDGNDDLSKTVNYERLFEIADFEMKKTQKLLETVAYHILEQIKNEFLIVSSARVAIRKMNPPLKGQVGSSFVELNFKR